MLNLPDKTAAGKGPEKKSLTAGEVQFDFRPDTHGLKDAETAGPGTLIVTPCRSQNRGKGHHRRAIPHGLRRAQPD